MVGALRRRPLHGATQLRQATADDHDGAMKPIQYVFICVAAVAVFALAPGVDIGAARLLSDPSQSFPFPLREWSPIVILNVSVPYIATAVVIGLGLALLAWVLPVPGNWRIRPLVIGYIALSLAVGPGLITNAVLKEYSGRARPAQVTEFGGPKKFTAAFAPARECPTNCAFVSGHAAMGFYLVTFALLMAPGRRRRLAIAGAVGAGSLFGLARMAEGGHWLSDVVFSGLINIAVAWAAYYWLIQRRQGTIESR